MSTPRTPGELLSQRPHTDLEGDDQLSESEYDAGDLPEAGEYDDSDDSDDSGEASGGPTTLAEEHGSRVEEARDQLNELLEDAEEDELSLDDYQRYWRRLSSHVLHHINESWRLDGPTRAAAARCGSIVSSGQYTASHLTQLYAARHLGVNFTPFDPGPGITERPSADKLTLYSRPIRERSIGAQLSRLATLANTDLQLAKVRTLYSAFDEDQEVNRAPIRTYRRVTESEKPCALCIIAADQVYFTTDLMPIHDNCECDVELADEQDLDEHKARYHHIGFVDSLLDTGDKTDVITNLADQDAPAEDYHNLIRIEQHGDLGPVITWADQRFTGPRDLPTPRPVRPVPTISGPGRGHEARLQRNAARVAQYRAQHFGPGGRPMPQYKPGHGGISTYLPPITKVARPIPKPKIAEVITLRPKVKAIDFDHDSMTDVARSIADKYTGKVGFDESWTNPRYNETGKRRVLQAVDEMLTKYPDVKIGTIGIADLESGVYAETTAERAGTGTASVIFNSNLMRMTPDEFAAATRHNERSGWFFSGAAENPYRYVTVHEYGHVLGNRGYRRANVDANPKMLELFNKSGRGEPKPVPHVIDRKADLRTQNMVLVKNIDEREAWIKRNEQALADWLAEKDRVSAYGMVDQAIPGKPSLVTGRPGGVALNSGEALAEAFAHVEIRPEAARELPKALHDMVVEEARQPRPATVSSGEAALRAPKESAVERLKARMAPKFPFTDNQMSKEDNFSTDKADRVILSDEQRTLAKQLATDIWRDSAKIEPEVSAAVRSAVATHGGRMSGFDYRLKTGPSLYRKIQAEAIAIARGEPVDEGDIRRAADEIKDAVRYTAVVSEDGYWDKGNGLRKALESLGHKNIKDPVGLPLKGYRGRNMSFTYHGTPFELQVHTELGVATKDEAHHIYDDSRKLKAALEAKGLDPEQDPIYHKMLEDMQAKWDTMPMTTGTPVVAIDRDIKDPSKILYVTDHNAYYGPSIPGGEAPIGSPEMLARERVPSTRYGMDWLPDSPEVKIVAPARTLTEDDWNKLPVQTLPQGTPLRANEGTLKKKSIDKVVGGNEPFREGYYIKLLETEDKQGNPVYHIVDGHTRVAMYHALGKDMPVRIMTQDMVDDLQSGDIYDLAKANGGITIDLGGHQPKDGYAYAPDKTTETKIAADKFTQKDVDDFIDKHRALLSKDGNNFGCWYEDGYYFLDVSRVGEASAETIEEAQKNEQLGIFDLRTFDTINIGKIDQGRYTRLDEAASIHNRHQEQIARDAESRSAASDSEVSGLGSGGAAGAAAPPTERAVK